MNCTRKLSFLTDIAAHKLTMASPGDDEAIVAISANKVYRAAATTDPSSPTNHQPITADDDDHDAAKQPSAKVTAAFAELAHAKRGLKQRHIQMIALAGTIGTGLFLSTGRALASGGPLGLLLAYAVVGVLICAVVVSVAEMSALVPLSGGVVRHAEYFFDPALAFAQGWNSVYANAILQPAEMVACAVIIDYWAHNEISHAVWIVVLGGLLVLSNFFLVSVYGELEFVCAMLKIALIIGVNIMASSPPPPSSFSSRRRA